MNYKMFLLFALRFLSLQGVILSHLQPLLQEAQKLFPFKLNEMTAKNLVSSFDPSSWELTERRQLSWDLW